jgi:roadblock/LC7 domain-containing protein
MDTIILPRQALFGITIGLGALVLAGAGRAASSPPHQAASGAAKPVSFQKQIQPILARRCQGCHQPASRGGKLAVTSYALLKAGGMSGAPFRPGDPDHSRMIQYVSGAEPKMPKGGPPLPAAEISLLRRWVQEGARDDSVAAKAIFTAAHPPVYHLPPVITALAYSPDGKTLAVPGYHEVLLHHADGSGLVARLIGSSDRIDSIAYSPDGKLLAAVGGIPARSGEVQFWDTGTNQLKNSVSASYDTLFGCSFSSDGKLLAFGATDNSARVITVPDGKPVVKLDNHSDWVLGTAFSRDGKDLVTASRDEAIKLTVVEGGSFVDDINRHLSSVLCLTRHPKEDQVLCGGDDGIPRLYQIFRTHVRTMMQEDYNLLREFERQPGPINAVAFSPDGELAAVGSTDGTARIYRTKDGTRVAALRGAQGPLFALAFRPDGQQIAVGGLDGQVRLFNLPAGQLAKAFVPVPLAARVAAARR